MFKFFERDSKRRPRAGLITIAAACLTVANSLQAGPWLAPGDVWLKADIQLLSDSGIITSPISSWPLSWGDIAQDLNRADIPSEYDPSVRAALSRLKKRARRVLRVDELVIDSHLSVAENPLAIRGFQDTPRGDASIGGRVTWTGERFAMGLALSYVDSDTFDDRSVRLDGSYAAMAVGNFMIGVSAMDRWWGPGWNGSLILSNSARPIPSLVIERNFSKPFENRFLSWLGPWSTSVIWGQLESDRAVSDARFFGWRVNFRPTQSLEIGLLRTAQWCGQGRACDIDAFGKVLIGDSNLDEGDTSDVANQLAGFDARWTSPVGKLPYALYGQLIGEDEAGGFPSRYMGQGGIEVWGSARGGMTQWRSYLEFADTTCQFHESSKLFNCAYNNGNYPTGYRYRGRSIGYATDNDTRTFTLGVVANDAEYGEWIASARFMEVNRGGPPDTRQTISSVFAEIFDVDLIHRRELGFGTLTLGAGYERIENQVSGSSDSSLRVFVGINVSN